MFCLQKAEITEFFIIQLFPVSCSLSLSGPRFFVSTTFCSTLSPCSSLNVGDQDGVTSQNKSLWDLWWTSVTVTGSSGKYFLFPLVSVISHMLHTNLQPHAILARTNEQTAETFQKKRSFAVGENWTRKVIPLFLLSFFLSLNLFLPTFCRCTGFCCTWSQTHRRTHAEGRTPLHDWSASRRDLYLTTHKSQQTAMPPARIEPAISECKQPQTHALDRVAIKIGHWALPSSSPFQSTNDPIYRRTFY